MMYALLFGTTALALPGALQFLLILRTGNGSVGPGRTWALVLGGAALVTLAAHAAGVLG